MKVKDIAAMEGITPSQAGKVHPCGAPAAAPVLHAPETDKRPMKTINLKKYYYPICKKDTFVEVPDEVADAIVEESRAEDANDAKQHYHCYSLDASPGMEHHFPEQAVSPGGYSDGEGNGTGTGGRTHALMMERLREALATLTPRQASCLHARFWEGKPFKEIAEAEGFTTSAAIVTVRNAIIKLQKYYIRRGWMEPPKEKAICTKTTPPKRKPKKDEREEVLKEIRQLENRQKILENKQRNEERKARTRRLIERGGRFGGRVPSGPRLPGVDVKAFLIAPVPSSGGGGTGRKTAEIRGQAVSPLFTRAHLYTVAGVVRPAGGCCVPSSAMGSYTPQTPCAPQGHGTSASGCPVPCGLNIPHRKEAIPIDFCHIPVSIIKRSEGRSAVAAAAYRSGTKLTNEWDGLTHDYARKGGVVHAEIMLPAHAPPEFADRSTLWNSVEQIEKARDSQLAREIEAGPAP